MSAPPSDELQNALLHARSGQFADAERICTQLLAQPAPEAEAFHLLGVIRNIQGRFGEAAALLRQAIVAQPGIAKYHSNLGNALLGLERPEEAEACYRQALALDPAFDDARANLAKLLHTLNRWDEAIAEYGALVSRHPGDGAVRTTLAHLLQSANRLPEAEDLAAAGLVIDPGHPALNLIMAICERRAGRFTEALARFDRIDPRALALEQAAALHYERGLLHDRLDRTEQAFADFSRANQMQAEIGRRMGVDKARYAAELDRLERMNIAWLHKQPMSMSSDGLPTPVFLVGFPRSGTTLLDQILDSHAAIQTLEEKPIIRILSEEIDRLVGDRPGGLADLRPDEIARLRALYFEYIADFIDLAAGHLLVDKLPLNLIRLPYILRLFPDARFILALRHPADCVLSCFMHLFAPNDAMAHFHTLEETAALYARVMGLWRRWSESLPLRCQPVRYENLVHDLRGEVEPVLDFLGVAWQEHMARPHEHAAQRGAINTPSHSQVTQPIYQRAAGRWQRYQPQLANVTETLRPHIAQFDYAIGP